MYSSLSHSSFSHHVTLKSNLLKPANSVPQREWTSVANMDIPVGHVALPALSKNAYIAKKIDISEQLSMNPSQGLCDSPGWCRVTLGEAYAWFSEVKNSSFQYLTLFTRMNIYNMKCWMPSIVSFVYCVPSSSLI